VFLEDSEFRVYAVSRNPDSLNDLKERNGDRLKVINGDISTSEGRDLIFNSLDGHLDILIHNAGKLVFKDFESISEKELKSVYEVNVFAPFLLTQKLLPLFNKTHIINISSIGGVEGSLKFSGLSAYSSSKAALNCLTEMLSEEFKDTDNSFNCLALGSVGTEMFESAFRGVEAASTPDEMARYIYSFALEAPKVMRGKIISVSKSNP
jgi:NAD(P)-dependent dehydrogenase (short-subunit alcohol dehydrogenase family)